MGSGTNSIILVLMVTGLFQSAAAEIYTVGGATGWTIPSSPTFYDDWAQNTTFVVGDELLFNYPGQVHSVLEVSEADVTLCNTNNALAQYVTSGGATVKLSKPGYHGYICGVPLHCLFNMRLNLEVAAVAIPPASTPAPSTMSPATSPDLAPGASTGMGGASGLRPVATIIAGAALATLVAVPLIL